MSDIARPASSLMPGMCNRRPEPERNFSRPRPRAAKRSGPREFGAEFRREFELRGEVRDEGPPRCRFPCPRPRVRRISRLCNRQRIPNLCIFAHLLL